MTQKPQRLGSKIMAQPAAFTAQQSGAGRPLFLTPNRGTVLLDYVPRGRRLHLVDIENLAMGPFCSSDHLNHVFERYRSLAPVDADDHVILAMNPHLAPHCHTLAEGALLRCGFGPDGADLALIGELADMEWVMRRFDQVVFGSGDSIFSYHARLLRRHGLTVGVVGVEGCISRELQAAAHFVRRIRTLPREAA